MIRVLVTSISPAPAKMAVPINMLYVGWTDTYGPRNMIDGGHMDAVWQIRSNVQS